MSNQKYKYKFSPFASSPSSNSSNSNSNSNVHLAPRHTSLPTLIVSTETASQASTKNGLSLPQLLAPFRYVRPSLGGNVVRFRSVGGTFEVGEVEVRFCDVKGLERNAPGSSRLSNSMGDSGINEAVHFMEAEVASELESGSGSVSGELDATDTGPETDTDTDTDTDNTLDIKSTILNLNSTSPLPPTLTSTLLNLSSPSSPHAQTILKHLDAQTNFQPHEMFGCPLTLLLLASTSDPDPISVLKEVSEAKRSDAAISQATLSHPRTQLNYKTNQ